MYTSGGGGRADHAERQDHRFPAHPSTRVEPQSVPAHGRARRLALVLQFSSAPSPRGPARRRPRAQSGFPPERPHWGLSRSMPTDGPSRALRQPRSSPAMAGDRASAARHTPHRGVLHRQGRLPRRRLRDRSACVRWSKSNSGRARHRGIRPWPDDGVRPGARGDGPP
jgi:hypothetical protein